MQQRAVFTGFLVGVVALFMNNKVKNQKKKAKEKTIDMLAEIFGLHVARIIWQDVAFLNALSSSYVEYVPRAGYPFPRFLNQRNFNILQFDLENRNSILTLHQPYRSSTSRCPFVIRNDHTFFSRNIGGNFLMEFDENYDLMTTTDTANGNEQYFYEKKHSLFESIFHSLHSGSWATCFCAFAFCRRITKFEDPGKDVLVLLASCVPAEMIYYPFRLSQPEDRVQFQDGYRLINFNQWDRWNVITFLMCELNDYSRQGPPHPASFPVGSLFRLGVEVMSHIFPYEFSFLHIFD